MSPDTKPHSRTASPLLAGVLTLFLAAVALWWMFRESGAAPGDARNAAVVRSSPEPERAARAEPKPAELAADPIRVMAAGSADNSETEPRHPHPITPAHERNFKQLNRIAQLNSLMDLGDVDELRQTNRKYREEYPEATLYQEGYDLIADCLEGRTSVTRAAAERYWNAQVASNLRRYIRRYCLD